MTRVLFLTIGDRTWASSRYRSYWPADIWSDADAMQWRPGQAIPDSYDVYVWMKTGDPATMAKLASKGRTNIVEVCDPNWWFEPAAARAVFDQAQALVAATEPAGVDALAWYGSNLPLYVVPDRLTLAHYPLQRQHQKTPVIRFVWFGVSANRSALFAAVAYLDRLAAAGYQFTLTICDNSPEQRWQLSDRWPIANIPWSLEHENAILASHDVALLPPYPGPWGKLKTNNKWLTAWASGLPVADCQDWAYLELLTGNAQARQDAAAAGYDELTKRYQTRHTVEQWRTIIDDILGRIK